MSAPGIGDSGSASASGSLARSIGWSALAQVWGVALSLVSAVVLARLLVPSDYAVLAIVAPVIGAAQNLQALGFGHAIIQASRISKPQLDALFWVTVLVSLAVSAAIVLAAPLIARFAHDPRVGPVLIAATLSILATALAVQPTALLARDLRFKAIAKRNVISTTISIGATIAVALWTRSYWSLVVGMIATPIISFILSAGLTGWRPGLPRRSASAGTLIRFGSTLWATNLLNYVSRNADNLIVGNFATARELGLYDRSYRVLFYPIAQAVLPLGQVLIPTLARNLDHPDRYRAAYWRSIMLLLFACLPGLTLCAVQPDTIFGLLLGPAWLSGAPLFAWFASAGLFQIYLATTAWLFISQGRGRELMYAGIVTSLVALVSFLIGSRWGILGVAQAYVLSQILLVTPFTLWLVGRSGPVGWNSLLGGLAPHALGTGAALMTTLLLRDRFGSPLWPLLLLTAVLAYLAYGLAMLVLPQSRQLALGILTRLLRAVQKELGGAQ